MNLENLDEKLKETVKKTFSSLEERGIKPFYCHTKEEALKKIFEIIPKGSAVANGSSTTLKQIGFEEKLLDGKSNYKYLNQQWKAESDKDKRYALRARLSIEADFYLGSVQAVCRTGEVIGTDATGSRQAFYIFGPKHIIWVVGLNKLVPTLNEGIKRIRETALPLEDKRMKDIGAEGSYIGKIVIYEKEKPGRITLILIDDTLGF